MAVEVLAREAMERGSPLREAAVAELANAGDVAMVRIPLRELINDNNLKIRILAYKGLVRHMDEKIQEYQVGERNFALDIVPSKGEPLIYATRALEGRIALIGDVKCQPPFFYLAPSRMVSASADIGQNKATLVRRTPFGQVSDPMKVPLDLGKMILFMGRPARIDDDTGKIKGLELTYGQVLQAVQALCARKAVRATLEMQQARLSDSLGVIEPMTRPESEITR